MAYFVLSAGVMRVHTRKARLRSILVLVAGLTAAPALALHEESLPATRITSADTHNHPYGRSWGNWFTFSSTQDLLNLGTTRHPGRQIFVFNMAYFDCFNGTTKPSTPCPPAGTPYLRQVTNGPGDPDNPSLGNELPLAAGQTARDHWIAFDALGVFNGNTGAVGSRRQIFLKNISTGEVRQVTASATGDSTEPSVNELAGVIVFESTANPLAGFPNPAGVKQVYLYQRGGGLLKRLSVGPAPGTVVGLGPAENPVTNQNGTAVAFQTTSDLMGDGHDTGVAQVYYVEFNKQNGATETHRVTNGNLPSRNPYLGDGPATGSPNVLVFDSLATDLPGASGFPGRQIYQVTLDQSSGDPDSFVSRITSWDIFGDCFNPHIDPTGNRVGFLCLGDPLLNSTSGNRLFVLDRQTVRLYQMTGAGDVQPNFGMNIGQWFVSLATTSDLTGAGVCGYQLYVLDFNTSGNPRGGWQAAVSLGQLPPDVVGQGPNTVIGQRFFELKPSTAPGTGSEVAITTRDGITSAPILGEGRIHMQVGAPDEFTRETTIAVDDAKTKFPPFEVPGFGALCVVPDGDGQGRLDCDGGAVGLDVTQTRDHHVNDVDPFCLTGCHENDASCQEHFVTVPHVTECPVCDPVSSTCNGGFYNGQACDPWPQPTCQQLALCLNGLCPDGTACNPPGDGIPPCQMPALCDDGLCPDGSSCPDPDLFCQQGLTCSDDNEPVCNGPTVTVQTGTYTPGGIRLTMPVRLTISQNPGLDDKYCTADDQLGVVQNLASTLRLTTGASSATITDADDLTGALVSAVETGAPTDCSLMRLGDLINTRLTGTFEFLDIPTIPGVRDLIVSLRFEAKPGVLSSCSPTCTTSAQCDDGNVCNGVESCVASRCTVGTPLDCDDANACNGIETCDAVLGCQAGTAPTCDDANVCTTDSCNTASGCVFSPNSNPCDDGNLCTTGDVCAGGVCSATAVNCSDGDACNGAEFCDATTGACQPGTPPVCGDANPCTDDSCDPGSGCVNAPNTSPCDDLDACTINDVCGSTVCAGTLSPAAAACNAGNGTVCDGLEQCNPSTGACDPGTPLVCDDGNPCTNDSCDPVAGCVYTNNSNPCSDGTVCTTGDVCTGGACVGTPLPCDDANACNGLETCDAVLGCQAGTPPNCNDGNVCTDDSCAPATGCVNAPNTNPCNDGNACTTGEVCTGGACTGTPVTCDDANVCNGTETCNPSVGCQPGTALVCNDGNACTDDACSPIIGCVYTNDDTNPCDDANACTTSDACSAGACAGTPVSCSNNDACDGLETCNPTSGLCEAGTPPTCTDGNPCTDDACVPATGCAYTPNTSPCNDGTACTSGDVCSGGACVGTPIPCNDSNACNGNETCDSVLGCQIGAAPNCNDGDECTADSCDPDTGCVNISFPNLAVCRLVSLIELVTDTNPDLLGGEGVKKRLLRKSNGALRATQKFYAGNPRLQRNNQRRASRRLAGAVKLVQNGLVKGTVDAATGDEILQLASTAALAISQAIP